MSTHQLAYKAVSDKVIAERLMGLYEQAGHARRCGCRMVANRRLVTRQPGSNTLTSPFDLEIELHIVSFLDCISLSSPDVVHYVPICWSARMVGRVGGRDPIVAAPVFEATRKVGIEQLDMKP